MSLTIALALSRAEHAIRTTAGDEARLEAEVLLAHVLGRNRAWLHTWPERMLADDEAARFHALVRRRAMGEPVAHLTGRREFWSLELEVTPATLIPRPDTEILVEAALALVPPDVRWRIADLGTGSGAIALALAGERPQCRFVGVDVSGAALEVAARNARRLGLDNIDLIQGEWLRPITDMCLEMIVSNPPYIEADDAHLSQGDVRFEPRSALVSGHDGLDDIRRIIDTARRCLVPGGWLLIEHGWRQGAAVRELLLSHGYRHVCAHADLAGNERVARGQILGSSE